MAKVEMVCSECGSGNVVCDAYAEWDAENQQWVLASNHDKGSYCNDCDGETRIVEQEIPDLENVKQDCISQAVAANLEGL